MNFKEILELIDRVAERGISGIEIEQAGTKIRIEGRVPQPQVFHSYVGEMRPEAPMLPPAVPVSGLQLPAAPSGGAPSAMPAEESEEGLHVITSPIVGTFYRSPNPEAESFANIGDRVSKGQVLCIIEAMKLMNEIESDVDGVIVKIYPQNAQPVEYGEKLFAVRV